MGQHGKRGGQGPEAGLSFSKYSGAGNDFVIVEAPPGRVANPSALARRICPRTTGVGVDGLILVEKLGMGRLGVRFFNPDGSEFGTCGNGSRCAALFAVARGLAPEQHTLVTPDCEIRASARTGGRGAVLTYAIEAHVVGKTTVQLAGRRRNAVHVLLGTPHLVVMMEEPSLELPGYSFDAECARLRSLPELGSGGANVHLLRPACPDDGAPTKTDWDWEVRTYERGVEGETLACGSGCMAAAVAIWAGSPGEAGRPGERALRIKTRSGEVLGVRPLEGGALELSGHATRIFEGVFPVESG